MTINLCHVVLWNYGNLVIFNDWTLSVLMQILYVWPALTTCSDPRQISLETERLGPRRVEGLRKEDEEWQKKAHAAVLSIQDLTVKFFETTTRAQKGKRRHFLSLSVRLFVCAWPLNLCALCLLHDKVQLTQELFQTNILPSWILLCNLLHTKAPLPPEAF